MYEVHDGWVHGHEQQMWALKMKAIRKGFEINNENEENQMTKILGTVLQEQLTIMSYVSLTNILYSPQPSYMGFDPNLPKKVVVMTYQRCGSSFFGQMFNTNPEVFYLYEPLDALYSALYGTREGWNVPSDISTFFNGTERSETLLDIGRSFLFLVTYRI